MLFVICFDICYLIIYNTKKKITSDYSLRNSVYGVFHQINLEILFKSNLSN